MNTALLFIAQQGYQDIELKGTRDGLLEAGFKVTLCSLEKGECRGKYDGTEQADMSVQDVDVHAFDQIIFIGGPGAVELWKSKDVTGLAQKAYEAGKIVGAICIAPKILAVAGILQGKKATVSNSDGKQGKFLEEYGAIYTGDPVTVDGRVITANGPDAAVEFGRTMASFT